MSQKGRMERKLTEEIIKEKTQKIEESIRKKFHKEIFSRFAKAINEYDLIQPNDKIAVCISGGKDSMLMAKLFQEWYLMQLDEMFAQILRQAENLGRLLVIL